MQEMERDFRLGRADGAASVGSVDPSPPCVWGEERGWRSVATSSHRLAFVARERGQRGVVASARLCGEGEGVRHVFSDNSCAEIRFRPLEIFKNEHKLRKPAVDDKDEPWCGAGTCSDDTISREVATHAAHRACHRSNAVWPETCCDGVQDNLTSVSTAGPPALEGREMCRRHSSHQSSS
jgi:hypothetical protein